MARRRWQVSGHGILIKSNACMGLHCRSYYYRAAVGLSVRLGCRPFRLQLPLGARVRVTIHHDDFADD